MKSDISAEKKRSKKKAVIDYVAATVLFAIWLAPIIWFVYTVCNDVRLFNSYFWTIFTGWGVIYIIQLFYDNSARRLLLFLLKALVAASKWDADSWFLQIFLWILLYCYGVPVVFAVAAVYAPASVVVKAVTGK